jgi:L-fucose isomerase-like protein
MVPDFYYEIVQSPLHDPEHLVQLTDEIGSKLHTIGGVGSPVTANGSIPFAVVVGTGGTEQSVIERWERRQLMNAGEPALVIAHRSDNSLAAALESLASIRQRGGRGRIVMIERLAEVASAVRHHTAYLRLRNSRLGLVGTPSDWLVASRPDAAVVRDRWGPTLVPVDLPDSAAAGSSEVTVELGRRWSELDTDVVVRRSEVDLAASLHEPLSNLMSANDLDAISVRCFDLLRSLNTSGCVALAELNSAGAIAGCEGDIPSTIAMMLVRELFGTASWMANPAWIDPSNGEIELAHCTVAPSLVEDVSLRTHFESGIGVGISGRFRRQHVTLLRIGGAGMDELWVSDGDLIATGSSEHLCRTQASVVVPPRQAAELLDRPLGNHLVMVPGMHAEEISTWWRLFVTG